MPEASSKVIDCESAIEHWLSFDVFTVALADLPAVAFNAICSHPEVDRVDIQRPKLWSYLNAVAARYHDKPFHNFWHAVDVTLAASALVRIMQQEHGSAVLTDTGVASLLIAAVVHDIDHPGVMNTFLVNTAHPLALLYSNVSVLEHHHSATAIELLLRPENDFLPPKMASAARTGFLKAMQATIMATDVTSTMPAVKAFKEYIKTLDTKPMTSEMLTSMILKAADISNPSRPLGVYQRWIDGVMVEFFAQGDAEKAMGLPVSMNCDRDSVVVSKAQVGFISFLVGPLFDALAEYAPNGMARIVAQVQKNKEHFQALAATG